MDLAEFLLARLAEDQEVARVLANRRFYVDHDGFVMEPDGTWADGSDYLPNRHSGWRECFYDPARVMAEVEAKRAILEEHSEFMDSPSFGKPLQGKGICRRCCDIEDSDWDGPPTVKYPCDTLRLLVLPYAEHPECHPSWLPAVKA